MNSPLDAAYYADQAVHLTVDIRENQPLAEDTYRVRFHCPALAQRIRPGQFVMLRLHGYDDPLIGRPLALYDTVLDPSGTPIGIDLVYLVKGKLTSRLKQLTAGAKLEVWGPLGNGFRHQAVEHLIMVAGGIGHTPFMALAQQYLGRRQYGQPPQVVNPASKVTLCYGARSANQLAGVDDFRLGLDVHTATDDGTCGHKGLVTELLSRVLGQNRMPCRIASCGPEIMMAEVARIAQDAEIACEVSLETPMACGIGICFTCVARVRDDQGQWDYKRTCVDGPVFDAGQIVW